MSEDYGISNDGGFHLVHMVQAQRGLSDREIEIFLATGRKPDLSQPPPEELERIDGDTQVMPLEDAAAWLSGGALTASSFFDFDPSHSVSPLYEVMRPKAFRFDPHQPRDEDGQWTDGPSVVKKTKKAAKIRPGDNLEGIGVVVDVQEEWSGGKPVKTTVKNEAGENHSLDSNAKVTVITSDKTAAPSAKLSNSDEAFDDDNLHRPLPNTAMPANWRTPPGLITHDDAVKARADALGGQWTDDQRRAVNEYTQDSADVNEALRTGSDTMFDGTEDVAPYVDTLDSALYPAPKSFTTYRQANPQDFGVSSVDELASLTGTDFADAAYLSTTISPRLNFHDMPVYIRINVPEGTRGAYVADASDFLHQREYILARNTKMSITKVKVKNGRAFVEMMAAGQDDITASVTAFRFDKNQPRDEDGKWTDGFPGVNLPDVTSKPSGIKTGGSAKSTKKVTPAVIYKKHDDGAVVGHSASGQRMRWDAGRKKFVVEKQKNDSWVEESAHTKTSAYNEFKNPDKWFEPAETGTENEPSSPSLAPEPDLADTELPEEKAPEAPAIPEPEKVTPEETSQDGYPAPTPVPEVDPDWPFSYEPFQEPQMDYGHLVRSSDDAYKNDPNHDYELKTLPVNTIVPSQENDYEEWGDGLDNDMTGKPLAIQKDGNLYLMDGHHRTAKAGEDGSIQAWVLDLDKPKAPETTPVTNPAELDSLAPKTLTPEELWDGLADRKPGDVLATGKLFGQGARMVVKKKTGNTDGPWVQTQIQSGADGWQEWTSERTKSQFVKEFNDPSHEWKLADPSDDVDAPTAKPTEWPDGWDDGNTLTPAQAATMRDELTDWDGDSEEALRNYTQHSDMLNNAIRRDISHTSDGEDVSEWSGLIDGTMYELPDDLTVFRHADKKAFGVGDLDELKNLVGKTWTDKAYLSTSVTNFDELPVGTARAPAQIHIKIDLPKGSRGAYIADVGEYPEQDEFLIARNSSFTISDVEVKDGKAFITMKAHVPESSTSKAPVEGVDANNAPPLNRLTNMEGAEKVGADAYEHSSRHINWMLREPPEKWSEWPGWSDQVAAETNQHIAGLDSAMEKSKLPTPIVTYRGIDNLPALFGRHDNLEGAEVTDPAFMSTTTNPGTAAQFFVAGGMASARGKELAHESAVMRMTVPEGIGAITLTPDGSNVGEVLLERGLKLRVKADLGEQDFKELWSDKMRRVRVLDVEVVKADVTDDDALVPSDVVDTHVSDVMDMPQTEAPESPEIPTQADAPAVESLTPSEYTGPSVTDYAGAPKDVIDNVRAAFLADYLHTQRVEDRALELRAADKEKYSGYDAWDKSVQDARTELGWGPPISDLDNALAALTKALPDYNVRDNIRRRISLEATNERMLTVFAEKNNLGKVTPELKADLAQRAKDAFAGKKVAVRVTPKVVEYILNDGRLKSQFESGKSKGKNDINMRASIEHLLFGVNDKPWQNPEKRPIYGYVAVDGIRPAGIGSGQLGDPSTDQLTQYGQVQVVLKDSVRSRTTAMFGDSLNNMNEGVPSPIDDPDWKSFTASGGGVTGKGLEGLDRSGESATFRAGSYAEAQIHGGVGIDDIEEIVFPNNPTATVKQQLEDAGIPYRVLNFKTAADGSDEDRVNALRIAEQDKPLIEDEIAKLQKKLADPKYVGDEFYKKDLAKYEKQLKTINDALPALRGEKKSAKSKVAAAKAKVATATAPKQAEAPKIESAPALGADFADVSSRLDKIFTDNEYYGRKFKELFEKQYQKASGVLNSADQWTLDNADKNLTQAWKDARPDVSKAIDLLVKRAQAVGGNDANGDYWSQRSGAKVNIRPKVNKDVVDKIAERYVSKDLVTITHNAALRSGSPDAAALKWTKSMDRMTDSGEIPEDTRIYRGAAFSPEFAASLTPGSVMLDNAFMSAGFDDKTAKHYAGERQRTRPGHIPTIFEIRVPGGTRAYEVENDELVFGRGKALRIVSVQKQDDDYMRVIVDMLTPEQAEELANG